MWSYAPWYRDFKLSSGGNKMKTLIFNGSPRKNGDTAALVNELLKHLEGDIKVVNTYTAKISPCTDCRYCWKNDGCIIDDEMQEVYRDIDDADNIVIASPIFFSELTGPLLGVASRLQQIWISEKLKNKKVLKEKTRKGFIILVGGGDGKPEKALGTAKVIFKHMGTTFVDSVISPKTDKLPAKDDVSALENIKRIAQMMRE